MPSDVKGYPYAFHIALDGNGINGLEGFAGVCLFLYDPSDDSYAYKIVYYDGIAGGHAVSVNPNDERPSPTQVPATIRRVPVRKVSKLR